MGLTIHYTLRAERMTIAQVRKKLLRLWDYARSLDFSVGELLELPRQGEPFCDGEHAVKLAGDQWLFVRPERGAAFRVDPGRGSESATFGLARYPAKVRAERRMVSTGISGWSWQAFCKTQYASDPRHGGLENFLRCHLGVVALLDAAATLGLSPQVTDEGGYWEKRDRQALAQELGQWNECIAAFGGALKDAHGDVQSPIFSFPNFEPLEARGQRHLRRRR
jgi:hypothetical protein